MLCIQQTSIAILINLSSLYSEKQKKQIRIKEPSVEVKLDARLFRLFYSEPRFKLQ